MGLLAAVVVVFLLLLKRLTQVSPGPAQEWLKKGALVIDVRTIHIINREKSP